MCIFFVVDDDAVINNRIARGAVVPCVVLNVVSDWHEIHDEHGMVYYFNVRNGATQWTRPPVADLSDSYSFMGIPIEDPEMTTISNRIMILSAVIAALIAVDATVSFIATGNFSYVVFGTCMLLIPSCGYLGAKNKSRHYMCCFCGWSFACFIIMFINVMVVFIVIVGGRLEEQEGPTYYWIASLVINASAASLYFVSFHYGKALHQNPYFEPISFRSELLRLEMSFVNENLVYSNGRSGSQRPDPAPILEATVVPDIETGVGINRENENSSSVPVPHGINVYVNSAALDTEDLSLETDETHHQDPMVETGWNDNIPEGHRSEFRAQ